MICLRKLLMLFLSQKYKNYSAQNNVSIKLFLVLH